MGTKMTPGLEVLRRRAAMRKRENTQPIRTYKTRIHGQTVVVKVMPTMACEGYLRWRAFERRYTEPRGKS